MERPGTKGVLYPTASKELAHTPQSTAHRKLSPPTHLDSEIGKWILLLWSPEMTTASANPLTAAWAGPELCPDF